MTITATTGNSSARRPPSDRTDTLGNIRPTRRRLGLLAAVLLAGCTGQSHRDPTAEKARGAATTVELPAPLSIGQISQLMWAARGITHDGDRRTAPSAGALSPLELYVVTSRQVLRYLPDEHRAEQWPSTAALAAHAGATPSGNVVRQAPATFVIAGVTGRTARKYGASASRYVALEAGHAAQSLCLQVVGLELGAVTIGALDENAVSGALPLSPGETPYYINPVGFPAART